MTWTCALDHATKAENAAQKREHVAKNFVSEIEQRNAKINACIVATSADNSGAQGIFHWFALFSEKLIA
jgi:hypothetical protein